MPKPFTPSERIAAFWSKVDRGAPDECWPWLATTGCYGGRYGGVWWNGRMEPAHRVAYELIVGPIAAGRELDHLCRNTHCVNPAHLEAVSHAENTRRWWQTRKGAAA